LATNAIVSHSIVPLKIAGYLGGLITVFSLLMGLFMLVTTYVFPQYNFNFTGTAMLAVLNLFLAGITLVCLGLISLYIAHIQNEVTNRPLYLVRQKYNFD
jgi:dolichol-phosphate mannosyltransferase